MKELTETERKLVKLMLCPAAPEGEFTSAVAMFARSLRKRKVKAEQLFANERPTRDRPILDPGDIKFPFGCHKGKAVREVPSNYLTWVLATIDGYPRLIRAVQRYLRSQEVRG